MASFRTSNFCRLLGILGAFSFVELAGPHDCLLAQTVPSKIDVPMALSKANLFSVDPWRGQSPFSQVAANLFRHWLPDFLVGGGSARRQEPQVEMNLQQLKMAAHAELERLRGHKEMLSRDQMAPLWEAVRRVHERGYEARSEVIALYTLIADLPLELNDRLEVCRFLGQDCLFNDNSEKAAELFAQAIAAFHAADEAQQKEVARTMSNIYYLRGVLGEWEKDPVLLLENDRELYSNKLLWNATPVATKASLLERLGDQMARRKELEEAREMYLEAVDVLRKGDERDTEQNSTIRLLIKTLRVEIAAGKVTLAEAIQRLEEMRKDYATGNWVGMEEVLKQLAVYYRENKDSANYQKVLSSLRDWYREQRSDPNRVMLTVSLIDQGILDSTKLLVLSRLETGDRAGAVELIRETLRRDKPPEWWVNHFPDDVRTEAMEQSVVGEKSGKGKKPAEPDRESSADRNGEGGRIPAGEGRR